METRKSTFSGQPGFDSAVLRQAALGDVELGHHFQARDHCGFELARRRFDFMQNAVDAVAHLELIFEGLDVNVRGAAFERAHEHLVDQANDRHFRGHVAQMRDVFFVADAFDWLRDAS